MYTPADIQKIVSPIAAKYGVQRMYLFGSYATGKSTPDSDVDLRIDKGSVKGMQMAFCFPIWRTPCICRWICFPPPRWTPGFYRPSRERRNSCMSEAERDLSILEYIIRSCDQIDEAVRRFGNVRRRSEWAFKRKEEVFS